MKEVMQKMANKVLSIKMDEKDIERLKKYYEALIRTGFLQSKTMSLNAFYKHLLLDYLEDDVYRAFETYSNYGLSPRFINPKKMDDDKSFTLNNTYNLDAEMFEVYKKCVKETLNKKVDEVKESAEFFNELVKADIIVTEGSIYKLECFPLSDLDERIPSFWEEKAFETMELCEKDYRENEIEEEVEMIEKSSISAEVKQKLINEILEYDKKRRQNYSITQGREIVN